MPVDVFQVVELLSTVIEHLVRGEVIQIKHALKDKSSINEIFDVYLKKSYYKTASLMANSCKVSGPPHSPLHANLAAVAPHE